MHFYLDHASIKSQAVYRKLQENFKASLIASESIHQTFQ